MGPINSDMRAIRLAGWPPFSFAPTNGRRMRTPQDRLKQWEKACRQKWRALALCIKAKLEAVEAEISEFEEEFMAHVILPDGSTVSEFMRPQIRQAYATRQMPPGISGLLPPPMKDETDG